MRLGSWERKLWEDFSDVYNPNGGFIKTGISAEGNLDAFGRVKVSDPVNLFDSQMQYDKQPLLWAEKIVGTGSVTHNPNESSADLTIGTASGDRVVRQTREYIRYQPGKSQSIFCTGTLGASQAGTIKLVGYGDDNNGLFFGSDGGGTFVLLRSNVSGTPDDSRKVYQQDWNIDPVDSTGPSGVTLDINSAQIFTMDVEWLGVGRVRMGVVVGGSFVFTHEFLNANARPTTYMTTANLPIRYEVRNTAAVAATSTLKQICAQVSSEGGVQKTDAYPFSVSRTGVSIPNGAENTVVILAARHATTFNSIENRIKFSPLGYETLPTGGRMVTKLLYNPTLVGGTWDSVDPSSGMEWNSTVESFSGGIETQTSFTAGGNSNNTSAQGRSVTDRLPFGLDVDGANPVTLALVAYALDNGVSSSFSFQWEETR